jgi:hypothetical protein
VWSVAVGAQSSGTMARGDKMDKMEMKDTSYTGCIEAGSATDVFTLTHLAAADRVGKDMLKKDAMKNDTMAKERMQTRWPQGDRHRIACARQDGRDGDRHDGQGPRHVHREVAEDGRGDLRT